MPAFLDTAPAPVVPQVTAEDYYKAIATLDDEIISLIHQRVALTSDAVRSRLRSSLSRTDLAWENRVITRYGADFEQRGVSLALLLLGLPGTEFPA